MILGVFFSTSYVEAKPPESLPDVSQAPWKVKVIEGKGLKAYVMPLYTTFGNPNNYITPAGGLYDGVGDLILTRTDFTVRCSGALLSSGLHVLTAGHCVTDDFGNLILQSGHVTFEGDNGNVQIPILASQTTVHPDWDGDIIRGNDLSVLLLATEAPAEITRYDIDRNGADDVGAIGDKAGYGRSGNGNDGDVLSSGTKRDGQNKYDDVADTMLQALGLNPNTDFVSGSVLQYDFDNGLSTNDGFGFFFSNSGLGLGVAEVNSAPGDSGGPTITNGVITGITSYGLRLQTIFGFSTDVDSEINSTFGEFSGDTRVSSYHSFIDGVLSGDTGGDNDPPSNSLYVSDISINGNTKTRASGLFCKVTSTITIEDQDGQAAKDALVSGSWSGAVSSSVSAKTRSDGEVTFRTGWVSGCGVFTFTVDDLSKSGYGYDSASNIETTDSWIGGWWTRSVPLP